MTSDLEISEGEQLRFLHSHFRDARAGQTLRDGPAPIRTYKRGGPKPREGRGLAPNPTACQWRKQQVSSLPLLLPPAICLQFIKALSVCLEVSTRPSAGRENKSSSRMMKVTRRSSYICIMLSVFPQSIFTSITDLASQNK